MLEDARPEAEGLQTLNGVAVARFKKASGQAVAVVWTRQRNLTLDAVAALKLKGAKGFDIMGNPVVLSSQTPIGLNPIYIMTDN